MFGLRRSGRFASAVAAAALLATPLSLIVATATPAHAAGPTSVYTWTGDGGNALFANGDNWSCTGTALTSCFSNGIGTFDDVGPGHDAGGSYQLVFPTGIVTTKTLTDDIAGLDVDSVLLQDSGFTINQSTTETIAIEAGGITDSQTGGLNILSVPIVLGADQSFTTSEQTDIFGVVSGAHNLITSGGVVAMTASNTYTGTTTVAAGTLSTGNPTALGLGSGGVTVHAGAALEFDAGTSAANVTVPITLNGSGSGFGSLFDADNTTVTGQVTLATDAVVGASAGDGLNLNGVVTGPGSLTYKPLGAGAGMGLGGAAANTYSGPTTVLNGTLDLNKTSGVAIPHSVQVGDGTGGLTANLQFGGSNQIATSGNLTVDGNGAVLMDIYNNTITGLTVDGNTTPGVSITSATGTLTITGGIHASGGQPSSVGANVAFPSTQTVNVDNGSELDLSSNISGIGGLSRTGTGLLVYTGSGTYTGATSVTNGHTELDGTVTSAVTVTADNGALLEGAGTATSITLTGTPGTPGTIDPGNDAGTTVGTLTTTGVLTLGAGSTYNVDLGGTGAGASDQLVSGGTVTLGNGSSFPSLTGALFGAYVPTVGDQITIVKNNSGSGVVGQFQNLTEGTNTVIGGFIWRISYVGGASLHDIVLTNVAGKLWTGAVDNKWSTAGNWTPPGAPATTDNVVFPASALNKANTVDTITHVNTVTFSGSGYNVTGTALRVDAGITDAASSGGNTWGVTTTTLGAAESVTTVNSAETLTVSGAVDTTASDFTFTIDGAGLTDFTAVNGITGGGTIVKAGTGRAEFEAANNYTGTTLVNQGTLRIDDGSALGTLGSGTSVAAGATLDDHTASTVAESITLIGGGVGGVTGALEVTGPGGTWSGPITLSGDSSINTVANLIVSGVISGPGGLTKLGSGTLMLTNANGYGGITNVDAGNLLADNASALGTSSAGTNVNAGGVLTLTNATYNEPVTMAGGLLVGAGTPVTLAGSLTLNSAATVSSGTGSMFIVSGLVSGSGALTKGLTGTLVFPNNNTYTGQTTINNGVLLIKSTQSLGTTGSGTTVNSPGQLAIDGGNNGITFAEGLTLNGVGGDAGGTGALRSECNISIPIPNCGLNIEQGPVTIGSATTGIGVDGPSGDLQVTGPVQGLAANTLQKLGAGTLTLSGSGPNADTYAGPTDVANGVLEVTDASALGATSAGTTVDAGATLASAMPNLAPNAEPLTLNGTGFGGVGALEAVTNNASDEVWTGTVTLGSNATISSGPNGGDLTLMGVIGGAHGVTIAGTGTVNYSQSAANTYTGTTVVRAGTLNLNDSTANGAVPGALSVGDFLTTAAVTYQLPNQVADAASVGVFANGSLSMNGNDDTIGPLEVATGLLDTGGAHLTTSGLTMFAGTITTEAGSLILGGDVSADSGGGSGAVINGHLDLGAATRAFSVSTSSPSPQLNIGAVISNGSLSKGGSGTLVLSGISTYTGATTVSAGALEVDGNIATSSGVTVSSTAMLTGTGTTPAISVSSGATLYPGDPGLGTLTTSGALTMASGSTYEVSIGGTTAGGNPGYNQLVADGINLTAVPTLHINDLTFASSTNNQYVIIANTSGANSTGQFLNLGEGQPSAVNAPNGTRILTIHYNAGPSGHDVVLVDTTPFPGGGGGGGGGGGSQVTVGRLAGGDRIATAIAVSQDSFPNGGANALVLARSDVFADALPGTPLAVKADGPMLLTPTASLDPRTEAEIKRVLASGRTVFVLGLQGAISDAVVATLQADGYNVVRLGGANRYATAVAIAQQIGAPSKILVATGLNPADALAGGAAAAKIGGVVVLTADTVMPPETLAYINATNVNRDALGGPAAAADPGATPLVGADRYATSVLVAQTFFSAPTAIGFANGFAFPDALSGGANVGLKGGPLVLVDPSTLPKVVHDYLNTLKSIVSANVYGGTAVVPATEQTAIQNALNGM